MPTLGIPNSAHALMIRVAISPRLAAIIFLKGLRSNRAESLEELNDWT